MQLKEWEPKVQLNHTKLYSSYISNESTEFIKNVRLFRFFATGKANIGYVRKDSKEIYWKINVDE